MIETSVSTSTRLICNTFTSLHAYLYIVYSWFPVMSAYCVLTDNQAVKISSSVGSPSITNAERSPSTSQSINLESGILVIWRYNFADDCGNAIGKGVKGWDNFIFSRFFVNDHCLLLLIC